MALKNNWNRTKQNTDTTVHRDLKFIIFHIHWITYCIINVSEETVLLSTSLISTLQNFPNSLKNNLGTISYKIIQKGSNFTVKKPLLKKLCSGFTVSGLILYW